MSGSEIEVEVVYALPLVQECTRLRVPDGTTVAQALARAGVVARHPEVDVTKGCIAIYGRPVSGETTLRDQDRIEILRPLKADPKKLRLRRLSARRR